MQVSQEKTIQTKTQKFILKFFPEIMIKGSSAKRQMSAQLYANLLKLLNKINPHIKAKKFSDKIEIVCPIEVLEEIREVLLNTPGIEQVLEALQFDNMQTLDDIKIKVNEIMGDNIKDKSFVVRAKRTGSHDFKSPKIEQVVGAYMLSKQ